MTPNHSQESKCLTCKHASIARGFAESQMRVECSMFGRMRYPIYECSDYRHKLALTLYQMMGMAKVIEKKDGQIGFRNLTKAEINEDYARHPPGEQRS